MYLIARSTTLVVLLMSLSAVRPTLAQSPTIPPFNRSDAPGEPPPVPGTEGEVQGRGPIHEGFAQPGSGVGRPAPDVPKQPPAAIPETPTEQRPAGDNVAWIPGYWSWDPDRRDFLWVSGFWRVVPAGRTWVSGYWTRTEDGWRWVSGMWSLATQPQAPYVPAPPDSLDRGPTLPPPDVESSYVPGTWLRDETRWLWRPGYYVAARAGLLYTPSRYAWTPRGYLFVPGFWDRPLESRGVLFAPVDFGPDFAPAVGWTYRPRYAVDPSSLLGSLWVGPGTGYYAFGDYYAARYSRAGYQSWLSYGPIARDPLYLYYRNANRDNPRWRGSLVETHNGRMRGTLSAPSPGLAVQGRASDAALRTITPLSSYHNPALRMANGSATERATTSRSTPAQRSPYAGYALSSPREAPRPTRSYTPPVQHSAPAPINRPRPLELPPTRHLPPMQHYSPASPSRHLPPVQHYSPAPSARYMPSPTHSAPATHSSARPHSRR